MGKIRDYFSRMKDELSRESGDGYFKDFDLKKDPEGIVYLYSTKTHLGNLGAFCRANYRAAGEGVGAKLSTPVAALAFDTATFLLRSLVAAGSGRAARRRMLRKNPRRNPYLPW